MNLGFSPVLYVNVTFQVFFKWISGLLNRNDWHLCKKDQKMDPAVQQSKNAVCAFIKHDRYFHKISLQSTPMLKKKLYSNISDIVEILPLVMKEI